ncbi:hypothetical protein K227x_33570 [Rubripirellula lacrimiformis]|uniref:Uncharacterized protein n=1 Tax=Rubripirellula lacrimiformis TaxID=1930273 RepID=A0A517NCU4_9BACT|nr:hypothetical protein K227x_33570 [Rubripirellula lacrimiformis]
MPMIPTCMQIRKSRHRPYIALELLGFFRSLEWVCEVCSDENSPLFYA